MASQKKSKSSKPRRPKLEAPLSIKEPPGVKYFPAPEVNLGIGITIDDLRRATADASWSVNEKLHGPGPLPRYPLGGSIEGLSKADPSQRINWSEIFSLPPQNPDLLKHVLELRMLPPETIGLLPISLEEQTDINLDETSQKVGPKPQRRKVSKSGAEKKLKKGRKK